MRILERLKSALWTILAGISLLTITPFWTAPAFAAADLEITKSVEPDPYVIGPGTLVYTLIIKNFGPDAAENVVVTDTLPTVGLSSLSWFIDSPWGPCSPISSTNTITCNLGTLNPAEVAELTISTTIHELDVPSDVPSFTLTNTASVTSDILDTDLSNNTATVTSEAIFTANLRIEKSVEPDPYIIGSFEGLHYQLVITNFGPHLAQNVVVTDTLPTLDGFPLVWSFDSPSGLCSPISSTNTITCNLGTLSSGATQTQIDIQGTIDELNVPRDVPSFTLTNTTSVTSDVHDFDLSDNTASVTSEAIRSANLRITKSFEPDPFGDPNRFTYELFIQNLGPNTAENVVVTDTLPLLAGLTVSPFGPCSLGPIVTCNLGALSPGQATQIDIAVTIDWFSVGFDPNFTGTLTNTASVTSDFYDFDLSDNTATVTTELGFPVDLAITKRASPDPVVIGVDELFYELSIDNFGPGDAQNVVVTDTLPTVSGVPLLTNVTVDSAEFECNVDGNVVVTCNAGTLPSFDRYSIAIQGTVDAVVTANFNFSGILTNTASVTSDTLDHVPANNTTSVTSEAVFSGVLSDEPITLRQEFVGPLDYFATGAPLAFDSNFDTRMDTIIQPASVGVTPSDIPSGARLVKAFLYWAGSVAQPDATDCAGGPQDDQIDFTPPGGVPVTVVADTFYCAGAEVASHDMQVFRADVTAHVGSMIGYYTVDDFDALISDGGTHNASFSVVLVYTAPGLPRRRINLYDGLATFANTQGTISLGNLHVASPPVGTLSWYVLDGDVAGTDAENVTVVGSPGGGSLTLQDARNPVTNPMNHSMDIDQFDISAALTSGDNSIDVTYRAGSDRWWLVYQVIASNEFTDADIQVSSGSPEFGDVKVGLSSAQIVTVSNVGGGTPLGLGDVFLNNPGSDFSLTVARTPKDIAQSDTIDIKILFSPTTAGSKATDLHIISDDPDESEVIIPISGTGISAVTQTRGIVVDAQQPFVYVFDADNDTLVADVAVPSPTLDCAGDQSRGFVSDFGNKKIYVIDWTALPPAFLGAMTASNNPEDLTISADQQFLLASGPNQPISVFDIVPGSPTSFTEIATFAGTAGGYHSVQACPDGSVLATNALTGTVHRLTIDATGNLTDTAESLALNNAFNTACPPPGGGGVALSDSFNGPLQALTYPPLAGHDTRPLSGIGNSAVISQTADRVFVRSSGSTSTSKVEGFTYNPATGALGATPFLSFPVQTVPLSFGVDQLATTPDKLYVPESFVPPGAVTPVGILNVYDASTGSLLTQIASPKMTALSGVCLSTSEDSGDSDGDGIDPEIDANPATFSNDFDDGTTFGTILDRGDQILTITPALPGVRIKADLSGGPSPAVVTACSGLSSFNLPAGAEVVVTCGSITIEVIDGTVESKFVGDDGQVLTTELNEGNSLTFDSEAVSLVAPSTNVDNVILLVDGTEFSLSPGATLGIVEINVKPGGDLNSWRCRNTKNGLPVGVLSHVGFDATTLDADSVRFGKTGLETGEIHFDQGGKAQRHVEDINTDGRLDMVFHFQFGDTGFSCGDIPAGKKSVTLPAYLRGSTVDGTTIEGQGTLELR